MHDFKAGDRVEYIGNTWSHRIGDLGSVVAESSRGQSMVRIVFDGETGNVGAYPKSLRLVNRPSVITIDRADLPEVKAEGDAVVILRGNGCIYTVSHSPESARDSALNFLALAEFLEAREKVAEETAAAEKEAAEMLTKRRDEVAQELSPEASSINNHQSYDGQSLIGRRTIDRIIELEAARG